MKYEIEYIEKIAKVIADNQLTEIILEDGEQAITVRKEAVCVQAAAPVALNNVAAPQNNAVQAPVQKEEKQADKPKGTAIPSPMVGAFYAAPAPGAKPFVKVGDVVSAGQVVCIVEAMKLMNEISAEFDCEIVSVLGENGKMVQYGDPLFKVRRV